MQILKKSRKLRGRGVVYPARIQKREHEASGGKLSLLISRGEKLIEGCHLLATDESDIAMPYAPLYRDGSAEKKKCTKPDAFLSGIINDLSGPHLVTSGLFVQWLVRKGRLCG